MGALLPHAAKGRAKVGGTVVPEDRVAASVQVGTPNVLPAMPMRSWVLPAASHFAFKAPLPSEIPIAKFSQLNLSTLRADQHASYEQQPEGLFKASASC